MMSLKRILVSVIAGVALLSVSGCSGPSPSVAARVGDVAISQAGVDAGAIGLYENFSQDPEYEGSDTVGFILKYWILEEKLTSALSAVGVTITDAERQTAWETSFQPGSPQHSLWTDSRTRSAIRGYIDLVLVNTMVSSGDIDATGFVEALQAVTVEVNPRYGDWDETSQYVNDWTVASRMEGQASTPLAEPMVAPTPVGA